MISLSGKKVIGPDGKFEQSRTAVCHFHSGLERRSRHLKGVNYYEMRSHDDRYFC